MTRKAHGQIRRGQVITTYGPGALIDLPRHSAIVGGLDTWPSPTKLEQIIEPRLSQKLALMTGVRNPPLYSPPIESSDLHEPQLGIGAWRFPEWFVVQDDDKTEGRQRSRRLVHRKALDGKGKFDGHAVVATRFVRACPRGHVDDLDWRYFVHRGGNNCHRQLWLDERGTSGDLSDLSVRCECGEQRGLYEATQLEMNPLGTCRGARPWLGKNAREDCNQPSRLLIRTASNAYFPQVVSVLSLPDRGNAAETAVAELWEDLQIVDTEADLTFLKKKPKIADRLANFSADEVLKAIRDRKSGGAEDRPVKQVELDALVAAKEGFGDDIPVDPNFHARRLPDSVWRRQGSRQTENVEAVIQLHRLREVLALVGFTRLDAVTPDINGEYESDVERAAIAIEPSWFPAVENRGEGIFVLLRADAVQQWLQRTAVAARVAGLVSGHRHWAEDRRSQRAFPGGPYILLHTLSHLLIQSLAMRCGYPASSIRERIYADSQGGRFGVLLYTGSPDADGTLGGLVQQARYFEDHLAEALRQATLCSNDPICARHVPGASMEQRWLHGAACHGCSFIAETSCEMRNDYLDRALVVPVLGERGAAFFADPV